MNVKAYHLYIMNLQKSGGNETFVKPTTDEELRLVDEFKKASK